MKTFIIIWFACGQSNEKSGTDSGTAEVRLHEAYPKLVSQSVVIARKRKITLPSFRRLCPELLSRTLIAETVVFIGCPGVPRIVRIDSVSVRARETSLPDLARQARFRAGIGTEDHGSAERGESPQKPASRLVCGQERRSSDGGRRGSKKEEKHRFFSPIPAGFRRIYFKAGIKTGVGFAPAPFTSTRNGGLFWAFVKPPGRNLRRGRFGFVSPRFVLSPFLPIQGGNA